MKFRVRNQPDFLTGVLFLVVGTAAALYARRYGVGSTLQMESGFFAVVVGGMLAVVGLALALRSLSQAQGEEHVEPVALRPLVLILGSVIGFGAMLLTFGLVISSSALVVVSSLASKEFGLRYVIPTAIVLVISCSLIFVYGLGLPIPLWFGAR